MVSFTSLWMPILVAAVLVFVVSAVLHMVFKYHNTDWSKLPDEDAALAALRGMNIPPGEYAAPRPTGHDGLKDPSFAAKMKQGPLVILNLRAGGDMGMGRMLGQWFVYLLIVSALVAYLASHTLQVGASYLQVFRVAGFTAFMAYAYGQPIEGIWYSRKWSTVCKNMFDGLVYALLTGGAFGWLWPRLAA
jgi:hypothetical protein